MPPMVNSTSSTASAVFVRVKHGARARGAQVDRGIDQHLGEPRDSRDAHLLATARVLFTKTFESGRPSGVRS